MLVHLKEVLNAEQVKRINEIIAQGTYQDGLLTAPGVTGKKNLEITAESEVGKQGNAYIHEIITKNKNVYNTVFPKRMTSLIFSLYEDGMHYDNHLDRAIMAGLRTDVSMTLFLKNADEYEGGELSMETGYGNVKLKGEAGDAVFYPSHMFHKVTPVTKGSRNVAVGWIQSLIRSPHQREILIEMSSLINQFRKSEDEKSAAILQRNYFHLLRMWSE